MSAAGLKDAGLLKAELKYGIPLSSSVTRLPGPDGVGIAPLPPTPGQDIQRPQLGIYIYISVAGRPPPSQTSRMWPMRAADAFDQSKYEYIGGGCAECCRPEPRPAPDCGTAAEDRSIKWATTRSQNCLFAHLAEALLFRISWIGGKVERIVCGNLTGVA